MAPSRRLESLGPAHRRQTHPLQPSRKTRLQQHAVREFVFASGNLSGQDMATALELALPKMRRLFRTLDPPFVASITRQGQVHLRWPKE
ncbi:MAG: hypothetical protein WA639_06655 [Candidatus Acidiferrum sp.]